MKEVVRRQMLIIFGLISGISRKIVLLSSLIDNLMIGGISIFMELNWEVLINKIPMKMTKLMPDINNNFLFIINL